MKVRKLCGGIFEFKIIIYYSKVFNFLYFISQITRAHLRPTWSSIIDWFSSKSQKEVDERSKEVPLSQAYQVQPPPPEQSLSDTPPTNHTKLHQLLDSTPTHDISTPLQMEEEEDSSPSKSFW